jgi:[glutamine synthetase] adenylyltransferase / [glutamine synthetase]-adenylyl-L-tyrosine phosphorylase
MNDTPSAATSPGDGADLWATIERFVMAAGASPADALESLRRDVDRSPDPQRSLRNLVRFLEAGFATSLLREFMQFPALQRVLITLLSQSQYLSDILVRDPELFGWLTTTDALTRAKTKEEILEECRTAIGLFHRIEKKIDAVKRIHRREYLRIGAKEILREAGVRTVTAELSALADAVIEAVLEVGHADLCQRTGASFPSSLAAVGLGKLGGQELNFSSDIDLMFVYDRDEPLAGLGERIQSTFEFYSRLAEFCVRALSDMTAEGRLYRVDLRLRPDGSSGALVMSSRSYLTYYETRGELWERQMLLKARIVAGNQETGTVWLNGLLPFLFPKTQLKSPLAEIAEIKRQIEARSDSEVNVKLGSGGIRDVEFTVQALQLLYGGPNDRLRNRNTLDALDALELARVLNSVEAASMREAYQFFRIVEHRLQLLHGLQTHSLPVKEEEFDHLARRLGFEGADRLRQSISGHRRRVRLVYESVFHPAEGRDHVGDADRRGLERLVSKAPPEERNELEMLISRISPDLGLAAEPEIADGLAHAIAEHGAAVWTLRNLQLLASAPAIRRGLQQSLRKSELAKLILLLAARSRNLTELLSSEPLLFETLVSQPEEFFADRPAFSFLKDSDRGRFQHFNEFKASLQLFLGISSFESFARFLSDLASLILKDVVDEAITAAKKEDDVPPLCIIALGKFGGEELTIASDLDCVVVYRGATGTTSAQTVERIAQSILKTFRTSGLYALDFRLRPEGHNAPLGAEFGYLQDYFSGRASAWEIQSLLKGRYVAGDPTFGAEVVHFLRSRISDVTLGDAWVQEVVAMRERMVQERAAKGDDGADLKLGSGGLVDLEFAVQMLQLRYGGDDETFLVPNTLNAVRNLHQRGYLSSQEWKSITSNMIALRTLETLIRLNTPAGGSTLPKDRVLLAAVAAAAQYSDGDVMRRSLDAMRKDNRSLFLAIAKRCAS